MPAIRLETRELAALMKALADETRLRIVALLGQGELCVCHIEEALELSQPNVSRHLAVLRAAGVVEPRREGNWIHYRLAEQEDAHRGRILHAVVGGFAKQELLRRDVVRLQRVRGPGGVRVSRSLARRVVAEAVGTALLLAAVVGSGIMGERLAGGSHGLALLANSLATGAALVAIILALGSISAQLNPAITLAEAIRGALPWSAVPAFLAAQLAGAFAGVAAADLMFAEPVFAWSGNARADGGMLLAEGLATFGLVLVVQGTAPRGVPAVAAAVGCYIAAAYWFTSSTSFANPAVTLARAATDTFTGIRPIDVPGFLVAQAAGAGAAAWLSSWLAAGRAAVGERP